MKSYPILQLLVVVVAALPSASLIRRARRPVDMILCRRENHDDCTVFKDIERKSCINIPTDPSDKIQSVTFYGSDDCTFFNDADCHGANFTDTGEMPDLKRRFRNKLSSYNCD